MKANIIYATRYFSKMTASFQRNGNYGSDWIGMQLNDELFIIVEYIGIILQ